MKGDKSKRVGSCKRNKKSMRKGSMGNRAEGRRVVFGRISKSGHLK